MRVPHTHNFPLLPIASNWHPLAKAAHGFAGWFHLVSLLKIKDLARSLDANTDLTTGGAAEVSLRAAATAALEDMAW
jgi:hypothetical protein